MTRVMVTYRIDEEIIDAVKARAKADSRTITAVVGLALKQYLGEDQPSDSVPTQKPAGQNPAAAHTGDPLDLDGLKL